MGKEAQRKGCRGEECEVSDRLERICEENKRSNAVRREALSSRLTELRHQAQEIYAEAQEGKAEARDSRSKP
jgi:hypothetical protein